MNKALMKTIELDFTKLEFYDGFVISTINAETIFDNFHVSRLVEVCTNFYGEKDFVYVANRINDYNVNPVIYLELGNIKKLKGVAIVIKKESGLRTANFEKHFSPFPVELFNNLQEAQVWALSLIE